jgi:hypothetical protein
VPIRARKSAAGAAQPGIVVTAAQGTSLELFSLALAQAHPGPTSVLIDKLDAGGRKRALNYIDSCSAGLGCPCLDLTNSYNPYTRTVGKFLLCPV